MTPHERGILIKEISSVLAATSYNTLSDEEHQWVKLAIKREAQSILFRQKVIDSTATGLLWLLIVGLGVIIKEWLNTHGLKF
jgi:hypothetical protein